MFVLFPSFFLLFLSSFLCCFLFLPPKMTVSANSLTLTALQAYIWLIKPENSEKNSQRLDGVIIKNCILCDLKLNLPRIAV